MKRLIIVALALLVVLGFLALKFGPSFKKETGPVTLTWRGFEDENLVKPLILEYQKLHQSINISYTKESPLNYRARIQTQIRDGVGPDVFLIHSSWTGMFLNDLYPSPGNVFNSIEYQNSFYPLVFESFAVNKQILAAPVNMEGLALFSNEDILSGVGASSPVSWAQLIDIASKVTVRDSSGKIKTAGAALGSTSNIDFWPDIVGLLLIQQPGLNLQSLNSPQGSEVLRFYTSFITDPRKKTWDVNLGSSTSLFESGNLAFYFAPAGKAYEIKQVSPNLKFRVTPVPQLPGKNVGWGSFWAEAVSAKSTHPKESWEFVKFLSSAPAQRIWFNAKVNGGLPGQAFARVDLAPELASDPFLGAAVSQGPYYKNWYLNSQVLDNGVNDETIKLWEVAINNTLAGKDPQGELSAVDSGVKQVFDKYVPAVAK